MLVNPIFKCAMIDIVTSETKLLTLATLRLTPLGVLGTNSGNCQIYLLYHQSVLSSPKRYSVENEHMDFSRRISLGEAPPLELGEALLGAETIERLGLKKVDANDIHLRPRICRRRT